MTDMMSFSTTTPRHALPMLFAGQAQKEVTVNEALVLADLLLQPVVLATATTAPATPVPGQCWIVGSSGTGLFLGKDDMIAAWSEGGWRFIAPSPGMTVYDVTLACHRIYLSGWTHCTAPAAATGGTVVDVQARAAISNIIALLVSGGVFSAA